MIFVLLWCSLCGFNFTKIILEKKHRVSWPFKPVHLITDGNWRPYNLVEKVSMKENLSLIVT